MCFVDVISMISPGFYVMLWCLLEVSGQKLFGGSGVGSTWISASIEQHLRKIWSRIHLQVSPVISVVVGCPIWVEMLVKQQ